MEFKRIFYLLLVVIVISPIYVLSVPIEDKDIIVIGGDRNLPPYEFIDEDGEYRGFNIDLMRALSIEIGREVKLIPMDWVDAHVALQNGEIDAIQGMNFNENRKEIYDFSQEYLRNSLITFVLKDNTYISNIKDLKGRRVGVLRNDSSPYALAEVGEIELVFFSDLDKAFDEVLLGKIDAVVCNKLTGLYIIQKNRTVDRIKIVGDEINITPYGMAFKKGNEELIETFNKGLDKLKRDGTYKKIIEKWFGKEIQPAWRKLKYSLYITLFVLFISLIATLVSFKWNQVLKREVEKQTTELIEKQSYIELQDKFKEQILDNLNNGIITLDDSLNITSLNRYSEEKLLLHRNEALGNHLEDLNLDTYFDTNIIESCLQKGKYYIDVEKEILFKGRKTIFSYSLSPLTNELGIHEGVIISLKDVTNEKLLKQKLAEKDKMQSLGRLVLGIAHEIRNPLTSIKTYVELLPEKYESEKFRSKISTQVPEEINRLNALLTDLLSYAKPSTMCKEKILLGDLLLQTVELFNADIKGENIDLQLSIEDKTPITIDKYQIKQVIINLILNSIEAVNNNGVIRAQVYEEEDMVILIIEDNGIGISEENSKYLFEPFFTTKTTGTGLGLAISYQYIKENKGDIQVKSEKDKGTVFKLSFEKHGGNLNV